MSLPCALLSVLVCRCKHTMAFVAPMRLFVTPCAATHAPIFALLPGRVGIHQVLETQKLKVAREQEQQGK